MTEERTETSKSPIPRPDSVLSIYSNQSESSDSSRSTLIREMLTSDKSKEIIDDIDRKISQLIDHINQKKYSERRKKYYTKKIINRIVENKYPDSIVNTMNFAQHSLPTSTPFDPEKDPNTLKVTSKKSEHVESITSTDRKTLENVPVVTPRTYSPNQLNNTTTQTEALISNIEKNVSNISVDIQKIKSKSLPSSFDRKSIDDVIVETPRVYSPNKLELSRKKTETLIEKIEKKASEMKNTFPQNEIKPITLQRGEKTVINDDCNDKEIKIENLGKEKRKRSVRQEQMESFEQQISETEDKNISDGKENKDGSLTQRYKKTFFNQQQSDKVSQFANIKDLTPRTLCKIYKLEFSESSTSSSNTHSSSMVNEDQIDVPVVPSKDWKYYKTTSEDIFEKKRKMQSKETETSTSEEELAIEYAKKERHRQITWINDEIRWLMKLKHVLEKNCSEVASISNGSPAHTEYKHLPRLVNYDSTSSNSSTSLKEINVCLDELHKILRENVQHVCTELKTPPTNSSSDKTDKNPSTTSSKPSQNVFGKNIQKPTEFEVCYFKENMSSSDRSCNETDKENISENQQINPKTVQKCDSEAQTSFRSSLSSHSWKKALNGGKKSCDIALQTSLSSCTDTNNRYNCNKKKSNPTAPNTKSIAYFLTFEEMRDENWSEEQNVKKVTSNLEKVKVKVPHVPKEKKKNDDNSELELQEYLLKNRSDFVKSAEWRRQCINELMYMRDKRHNDLNQRILFTTKEMKNMTDKKYLKTEEVQNKLKKKKTEVQKAFNRQLALLFSKKLQQKTLKGQVTISTSKTIAYP